MRPVGAAEDMAAGYSREQGAGVRGAGWTGNGRIDEPIERQAKRAGPDLAPGRRRLPSGHTHRLGDSHSCRSYCGSLSEGLAVPSDVGLSEGIPPKLPLDTVRSARQHRVFTHMLRTP